jgi:hypothetical protein
MGKVIAIKKASGRNIPESERNTVAVKLRLSPETAETLRELAELHGCTMSKLVDLAVSLLDEQEYDRKDG